MRNFKALEVSTAFAMIALVESPAFAAFPVAPAPVLGAGAGALALLGLGYYGLVRRRNR